MPLTLEYLRALIADNHELLDVEFKPACAQGEKEPFAHVVRACIAMANSRDGGRVVVGVSQRDGAFTEDPLTPEQLKTWTHDSVLHSVNSYCDPSIELVLETLTVPSSDRAFVVLSVSPFSEVPIVCKKDYSATGRSGKSRQVLRDGACYVRPLRKPESVEVPSHSEMRRLLDLALEQYIQRFSKQLLILREPAKEARQTEDREKFQAQVKEFLGD